MLTLNVADRADYYGCLLSLFSVIPYAPAVALVSPCGNPVQF